MSSAVYTPFYTRFFSSFQPIFLNQILPNFFSFFSSTSTATYKHRSCKSHRNNSCITTLLISVILSRNRGRKRSTMNEVHSPRHMGDNYARFNLKGIIVDENGLDILYWNKLQEENRTSFKKKYYHNMKDDLKVEEKRIVHESRNEPPPLVQQVHLHGGRRSSTSISPIRAEKQEQVANKVSFEVENKQCLSVQLAGKCTPTEPKGIPSKRSSAIGETASIRFEGDIMEALFGYVATSRKSPSSQIFILDTRKSQNTAVVLNSLGIGRQSILDASLKGRGLHANTIEKLARLAPTDDEVHKIIAFEGDPTRLADAESFLYHILRAVPTAFTRLNVMLFRSNYDAEVSKLKESLHSIESACNELRIHGRLLLKLLETMLKAGNRLNAGNARDLDLTALKKLSEVKSLDEKTTLLHFVVMEAIRTEGRRCLVNKKRSNKSTSKDDAEREYMRLGLPAVGCLSAEFPNAKNIATIKYDVLVKSAVLAEQVAEMRKVVAQCGEDGGFTGEMKGFLDRAEVEMGEMREDQARVMDVVKGTLDYYNAGSLMAKEANTLQLFVLVTDFLGMVDEAVLEITRIVSSPVAVVQTIFRFPKLSYDFMSEASGSFSSESGQRQ